MFQMTSRVHVKTLDIAVYTVQCIEYHKIFTKALTASLHLFEGFLGFHVSLTITGTKLEHGK